MKSSFITDSPHTEKLELLDRLLRKKGIAVSGDRAIPRRAGSGPAELSYGQERLWFLDQMGGAVAAYNNCMGLRLKGRLNIIALEQSIGEVRRRHESLRTIFTNDNGRPVQRITRPDPLTASVIETQPLSSEEAGTVAIRISADEAYARFDLSRGPLLRLRLVRLDHYEHLLLLTVHHIVSDGRSFDVLVHEVVSLYESFSTGQPSGLSELPIQYSDYAIWQRERLRGDILKTQLSYWEKRLGAGAPALTLPTDRPRPATNSFRGARESFVLPAALSDELASMARQEKTTLFVVLLAAFNVLLSRYSGQEDITIGAPIANRDRAEIEGLIGFFVNMIVLRGDLSGNPTFRQLIERINREALGAYAHQELPFELLVDHLKPERDAASAPLFQVCFALQDQSPGVIRLTDFEATHVDISRKATKFDLAVEVLPVDGRLISEFTYSTDQFDKTTIRRMGALYLNVLERALALGDRRLLESSFLGDSEIHQLLIEWNDYKSHGSPGDFAHILFETQALAGPDRIAIVQEEKHLTYDAVNRSSNQLAHFMLEAGLRAEGTVAISLGRSIEALVGMIGALKAGASFLPLDRDCPSERLTHILNDSHAEFILTTSATGANLRGSRTQVLCMESARELLSGYSAENPTPALEPESLAFGIYTSGSTGLPKGVQITHRGLTNLVRWSAERFEITSDDRATLIAGTAFDASVWEVWPYLAMGASLHVPDDETRASPSSLLEWEASRNITITFVPTPLAESVLSTELPVGLRLRILLTGGDRLHYPPRRSLPFAVFNVYGPTETCVIVTAAVVPVARPTGALPSIGRPLSNTQIYILGAGFEPVPIGAYGHLHIAGAGLARGYSGVQELTAERFVPNPLSNQPGDRLYRTGDLARFGPDGAIHFIGRLDRQVKIRGFRIELGEVEAALSQHPELREAAVLAQSGPEGSIRLAAYVTPKQSPGPDAEDLRRFLQPKLPGYMIPSLFFSIDQLPLTPNGKIDVELLPTLAYAELDPETAGYVAPRTPLEKLLAGIWAEVLGAKQVGVTDNFFHLGGDSILSIQIVARANQSGVRLRPTQVFQHQTIEALAREVATVMAAEPEEEVVAGNLPLTPIQLWFFEQNLPNPNHFNQAVMLESREALSLCALEQALSSLTLHHAALRHRFVETLSGCIQTCCEPAEQALLMRIDLSALQEPLTIAAVSKMLSCELQASLDISEGRLVRIALFDFGPGRPCRLLIIIHHLAVDGVSWRILLDDLLAAYQKARQNEPIRLPAQTTSYKRWAERLRAYAQSAAVRSSTDYWLETPWEQAAPLPRDYSDGTNVESSIQVVMERLSREQTRSLLQEVPAAYHAQINDVLITALAQAFSRWTGQPRLLLSMEGHGREEIVDGVDISRTVGWFTSLFPLLIQIDVGVDIVEALASIKEQLRRVPNRGVGFGLLRYLAEGAEAERIRELPQPEVSFNYLGQFDQLLSDSPLFAATQEPVGPLHGPLGRRNHLIEINASVTGGQLELRWTYSKSIHRRATIQRLAQWHLDAVASLINRRGERAAVAITPSDYPLARLDQHALDQLAGKQIEDVYGLTPMQHGMLAHTLRAPDAGMYVNQIGYALQGALNVPALRQAWQSVIDRHSIWRTGFAFDGLDEPLQIVYQRAELPWIESDWRCLSEEKQQEQVNLTLLGDFFHDFELCEPPLMRLFLIRLKDDTYQLICSFHHLVMDGWSSPLVLKDVIELYGAFKDGRPPRLAQATAFRDYVEWLGRQDRLEAENFWRGYLVGFTTPTSLKLVGASQEASKGEAYCDRPFSFSKPVTDSLLRIGRQNRLTMNTILQGLWALLLAKYSGEREVVFGAVVSGRPAELPGVENIVGPFINAFPVRVKVPLEPPVLVWLSQLQEQQLMARTYQYNSLVEIQMWTDAPRNQQLFESIIVFENYPVDGLLHSESGGAVRITRTHGAIRNNYPLTIRANLRPELRLNLMYDASRFQEASITQVFEHLQTLILALIEQPQLTVQSLISALETADRDRDSKVQEEFREKLRGKLKSTRRKSVEGWRATS